MSYALTDTQRDTAINGLDVTGILDISSNINSSPTAKQKVSADINQDGNINGLDVSAVLDQSSQIDNNATTAVLREGSKSDPFTDKTISIVAGNNMNFDAYLLGDIDGSYANALSVS